MSHQSDYYSLFDNFPFLLEMVLFLYQQAMQDTTFNFPLLQHTCETSRLHFFLGSGNKSKAGVSYVRRNPKSEDVDSI